MESLFLLVSFPLIISQKVTFYLQPHNIIIWTWHRSLMCALLNLCFFCIAPVCFSNVCTELAELNSRNPDGLQSQMNQMWIFSQPSGDIVQKLQHWHSELKLVSFGSSWHDNVPWSLENPHGFSYTVASAIFSSSVTKKGYIDLTLQIKRGDKSPLLFMAGGDRGKCSALSNLTAGVMQGAVVKHLLNAQLA